MSDAELNAPTDEERRAVIAEWWRLYGHADNPAWVFYGLLVGRQPLS